MSLATVQDLIKDRWVVSSQFLRARGCECACVSGLFTEAREKACFAEQINVAGYYWSIVE